MGCLCPSKKKKIENNLLENSENMDDESSNASIKKKTKNFNTNKMESEKMDTDKKRNIQIDKTKYGNITYDEKFAQKALDENNKYRKMHNSNPLKLDEYLCLRATIIAKPISLDESYDNENLLYEDGKEVGIISYSSENELNPEELMQKFYEEINDYNFIEPKEFECLSFTQMIWKNSKKFGIGYYYLKDDEIMDINIRNSQSEDTDVKPKKFSYVALYYPPGNKPGEYNENVLPRNKSKDQK
jgi:hypothetical protein